MPEPAGNEPEFVPDSRSCRDVLVVRHGNKRGRKNHFLDLVLSYMRASEPALASRMRIHATGDGAACLDGVDTVWFFLADPLRQFFPACFEEARAIAAEAHRRGLRVLNNPESLSRTSKSLQLGLWQQAGIPCGQAFPAADGDELEHFLERISYPAILRSDLGHTQKSAAVCNNSDEARAHARTLEFPVVLIEFIDVREEWRRAEPGCLTAQLYHKKRMMVFGAELLQNHVYFSEAAICGETASTFRAANRFYARPLRSLFPHYRETLAADINYSFGTPEHAALMQRAVAAVGLDVAAIDYSSRPDGSVVLWEANPYFAMYPTKLSALWRDRRIAERNWRFYAAMSRLLFSVGRPGDGRS